MCFGEQLVSLEPLTLGLTDASGENISVDQLVQGLVQALVQGLVQGLLTSEPSQHADVESNASL